jgi:hypothetical protein
MIGGNDGDMKFFKDMMDLEDLIFPKAIGVWLQLSLRGDKTSKPPTDDEEDSTPAIDSETTFDMGWIIGSGSETSEDDLPLGMVLPPSTTSDEIFNICNDKYSMDKCRMFGRNIGSSTRENMVRMTLGGNNADDQCRIFDSVTRAFPFHRFPRFVSDSVSNMAQTRANEIEKEQKPFQFEITFTDETATSCGLVVPDPLDDDIKSLVKSYGKPKIIEEVQNALGVRPSHLQFQYRNGGVRGLNRQFDVLLHYRFDV